MSDWRISQPGLVGSQGIAESSASAKHRLGTIVTAHDKSTATDYGEAEFIYLKGVASTLVGSVCTYDAGGFTTTLSAENAVGPIGISMSENGADSYGWYQISGRGVAKALSGIIDNKLCYLTATAGSIDDAVVEGDSIFFMETTSALNTPSSGKVEVTMNRPFTNDVDQIS